MSARPFSCCLCRDCHTGAVVSGPCLPCPPSSSLARNSVRPLRGLLSHADTHTVADCARAQWHLGRSDSARGAEHVMLHGLAVRGSRRRLVTSCCSVTVSPGMVCATAPPGDTFVTPTEKRTAHVSTFHSLLVKETWVDGNTCLPQRNGCAGATRNGTCSSAGRWGGGREGCGLGSSWSPPCHRAEAAAPTCHVGLQANEARSTRFSRKVRNQSFHVEVTAFSGLRSLSSPAQAKHRGRPEGSASATPALAGARSLHRARSLRGRSGRW